MNNKHAIIQILGMIFKHLNSLNYCLELIMATQVAHMKKETTSSHFVFHGLFWDRRNLCGQEQTPFSF